MGFEYEVERIVRGVVNESLRRRIVSIPKTVERICNVQKKLKCSACKSYILSKAIKGIIEETIR